MNKAPTMMSVALKAVAVGMATATVAFSALHIVSPEVCVFLLAVGLFAISIAPITVD
jgi:hypothetical protein